MLQLRFKYNTNKDYNAYGIKLCIKFTLFGTIIFFKLLFVELNIQKSQTVKENGNQSYIAVKQYALKILL